MMKFRKNFICILCAALILSLIPPISAQAAETADRYDPALEGIVSSYYPVDRENGVIYGIAPGTGLRHLQQVCLPEQLSFSADILATGTVLAIEEPDAEDSVHTLTAVVTGDLNGDGAVTITDMLMVKGKLLGQELTDLAQIAGDVNYDGGLTITDFLRLKACLLCMEQINAGRRADSEAQDPMLLLTPGESTLWSPGVEAAGFEAHTDGVTVAADGTVTAGASAGSTYIYALDAEGNVLARSLVTVVEEKLQVSFGAEEYGVLFGQTLQMTVRFNHPVTAALTWESEDQQIASVDENGLVTGHMPGVTRITATMSNGSTASATLTVIPPITVLEIGKSLYKVKPGDSRTLDFTATPADAGEEFIWTSSDPDIVTVAPDGTVTGVTYGTATVTVTGRYSGLTASCEVKICDVKQVAFTFDDGPSKHTTTLLDFCKENDIKVTFFLVANRLNSFPSTVRRQVNEGHEIGYHSWAHDMQPTLSSAQITSDFEKSNRILKEISGAEFTLWRTPGGSYNDRVTSCVPLPHILWSVDTKDWQSLNTYKVYQSIMRNAKDGSIILLHDLYSSSVNGAIMAMEEMMEGDFEFVTVTELLSRDGTPPENGKTYVRG